MRFLSSKYTKMRLCPGLGPGPHWGSLQHSPDSLAGFQGPPCGRTGKGEKDEGGEHYPLLFLQFNPSLYFYECVCLLMWWHKWAGMRKSGMSLSGIHTEEHRKTIHSTTMMLMLPGTKYNCLHTLSSLSTLCWFLSALSIFFTSFCKSLFILQFTFILN